MANDWRTAVPVDRPSLTGYLHDNGYCTLGQGKIFHGSKVRKEDWDEYVKDNEREESDKDRKDLSLKPGKTPDSFIIGSNAISTMHEGNHAVRTDRWRYIRYAGGGEELYDEQSDPHEWTNLAALPEHAALETELAKWLPVASDPAVVPAKKQKKHKKQK